MLGQWLFIKGLAVCYLFAFISLHQQVRGLFCLRGIIPIHDLIFRIGERIKTGRLIYVPTLFWFKSDDRTLSGTALAGVLCSLLLLFNVVPPLMLALLWVFYLSFVSVGAPFLHYQWDVLLLEAGFAAFFVSLASPPPLFIVFWLWILTFRFILASGLVKLLSRCPEWKALRAMRHHFETQPLPNLGGFFAYQFLGRYTSLVTVIVYFFELLVPFLFLGSEGMRATGAYLSIFFQALIFATGNFAFFNLLTVSLCFTLISDNYLQWVLPIYTPLSTLPAWEPLNLLLNAIGIVMVALNFFAFVRLFKEVKFLPKLFHFLSRFYILNDYGLFARMTTVRNEIVIEGSDDGTNWKEYRFYHKPVALNRAPTQIAPLQPRLDWQLWFSALSTTPQDAWWSGFISRLLQGSPEVLSLLLHNPFPEKPPRFIRAHLYRYRFNSLSEWYKSGNYWVRTYVGAYMRPNSRS